MRIRAEDVTMQSPEDLGNVLNMTVDDALTLALSKTEDSHLDHSWYEGILAKLGETEQNAFTLGLASQGIKVDAQLKDDVIIKLEDIVQARGFLYESDYRDACWGQSGEIVGAVNAWVMQNMIPLKRNPPKGDVSEQYKKHLKKNLNNPNVLNMKNASMYGTAALKSTDKRVIDAFIDKTEGESSRLLTDGTVLETMGFIGSGMLASWQDDKIVFEHHAFSRFEQWIFDYIEKNTPKAYLTKRGQATDFAMEQSELERAILAWEPKLPNIKEWLSKVRSSKTVADLRRIWDQLWRAKEETEPMVKKTEPYRETVELEEGPALELAHLRKAKKLLAAGMVSWEDMGGEVWLGTVRKERNNLVFRIDGREKGYRVDMMTWTPWEAIDKGTPFDTLEEAKAWVETYYAAVLEQKTVHPKITRKAKNDVQKALPRKVAAIDEQEIKDAIARTLWVDAWGQHEEEEDRTYPGEDLMDVAPETPPDAYKAADTLWSKIKAANPDKEVTTPAGEDPELFGFYLAMEALGHGVAWTDDHEPHGYKIPRFEYLYTGEDHYFEATKKAARNIHSSDPEQFERYLTGVVILDGEGTVTLYPDKDPQIHIAIIHDGSGYNPGAAIYVAEEYENAGSALEKAYEILENKAMEDTEHVKELQDEWDDRWNEILTETFDGMVFTLPASVAAQIISKDRFAKKHITIEEGEGEEDD